MNTATDPTLDQALAHAERVLRASRSTTMRGWSLERIAQHADRLGCVAVITLDDSLPGKTRVDFLPRAQVRT